MKNSQNIEFSIVNLKEIEDSIILKPLLNSLLLGDIYILGSVVESSYNLPVKIIVSHDNNNIFGYLWVYQTGYLKSKLLLRSFRRGLTLFNCTYDDFVYELCNFCDVNDMDINGIYIHTEKHEIIYGKEDLSSKKNILLSLDEDIDQCWKDLPKKTRNMVRKGKKSDIKLSYSKDYLLDFYKIYSSNMLKKRVIPHSLNFFEKMMKGFGDRIDLITAIYDNKVIGGIVVQYGHDMASYPFHSSITSFNYLAPNHLLVWSMVEKCVNKRLFCIDMGEGSTGSGVYNFKKSFGGDVIETSKICLKKHRKAGIEKNKIIRKTLSLVYYNFLKNTHVHVRSFISGRKKRKSNLGM